MGTCEYHNAMPNTHRYGNGEKISIGEAARIAGVSISTLRRWEREGRISPERTLGGQRRYLLAEVNDLTTDGRTTQQASA